ncbi:MAG: L-threonylcarbamoyladenylate synthase [Bacilli bacterium]
METKVYDFDDEEVIQEIRNNNVIALPTETVYGLGVIYDSLEAFEKLVKVKQRKPDKPFTLMLSSIEDISNYAYFDENTYRVIQKYMPGEITLLLKPKEHLFPWVTLHSSYIGIRIAGLLQVGELIKKVGRPMLVTSANISSFPACVDFRQTYDTFSSYIPAIIKGETSSSIPSTIVKCDEGSITLIRQGRIPFEEIKKTWEG